MNVPSRKYKGAVNYVITRLVLGAMKPEGGWGYSSLSDAIGVLRDAADEISKRLLSHYENTKMIANGDVKEFVDG